MTDWIQFHLSGLITWFRFSALYSQFKALRLYSPDSAVSDPSNKFTSLFVGYCQQQYSVLPLPRQLLVLICHSLAQLDAV